jgi:hypothetical protein
MTVELSYSHIFDTVGFLGVFSTAAALVPALFSSHVQRSGTWYGVLAAFMLYSMSHLLLINHRSEPPLGLCIFQTALIYGTVTS